MKIVIISTVPTTQTLFLKNLVRLLKDNNYTIYCISSLKGIFDEDIRLDNAIHHTIPLDRTVNIKNYILSFFLIRRLLKNISPDIVYFTSPVASLLSSFACLGLKCKTIYHIRGIIASGKKALTKKIMVYFDKTICFLSNKIIVNSSSNLEYLVSNKIAARKKCFIPNSGSSHGVDFKDKFNPDNMSPEFKTKIIFGFIGRIERDKGIDLLLSAWNLFSKYHDDVVLYLIGPISDSWNSYSNHFPDHIKNLNSVRYFPSTNYPEQNYSMLDVFVFPSYREGFPNVVLEASAMKLPVITTDAIGCIDSVIHNETGLIFEKGNIHGLLNSMEILYNSPNLRKKLGENGRKWVSDNFDPDIVNKELYSIITDTAKST